MISKNQIKQIRLLEHKKYRRQEGAFVAEGPKVVGDLLDAGFRPIRIWATDAWKRNSPDAQIISAEELRKVSFLQHPQQVLALFQLPDDSIPPGQTMPEGLVLALDGVQDPGNLGTIIRIADWFGIDTIYCSLDTADAWNPKVVQATMGSIARVRLCYTDLKPLLEQCGMPVYGLMLGGRNIYEEPLPGHGIILMGNEGNGISAAIRPLITTPLLIPRFHEGPESLNVGVATAIACSEFKRRT